VSAAEPEPEPEPEHGALFSSETVSDSLWWLLRQVQRHSVRSDGDNGRMEWHMNSLLCNTHHHDWIDSVQDLAGKVGNNT